jgi:hypothetical protein
MAKLARSKWLLSAGFAFLIAIGLEIASKQFTVAAVSSIARRTARLPARNDIETLLVNARIAGAMGLAAACLAACLWYVSAHRREPGSALLALIPALTYGMSLLLMV